MFALDEQRFALPVSVVERVVRSVEITHLPEAPPVIQGIINVQGNIVPVFNLRRRFQMPERDIALTDHIIIVRAGARAAAIVADSVSGVLECAAVETVSPGQILPGIEHIAGVIKHPDGLIFIHDPDQFLSLEEAQQLEGALAS